MKGKLTKDIPYNIPMLRPHILRNLQHNALQATRSNIHLLAAIICILGTQPQKTRRPPFLRIFRGPATITAIAVWTTARFLLPFFEKITEFEFAEAGFVVDGCSTTGADAAFL